MKVSYLRSIKYSEMIFISFPKIRNRSPYQKTDISISPQCHGTVAATGFCCLSTEILSPQHSSCPRNSPSKCFMGSLYLSSSKFITEQLEFRPGKQTIFYTEERDMMISPFISLSCWKLWNYQKTVIMKMLN